MGDHSEKARPRLLKPPLFLVVFWCILGQALCTCVCGHDFVAVTEWWREVCGLRGCGLAVSALSYMYLRVCKQRNATPLLVALSLLAAVAQPGAEAQQCRPHRLSKRLGTLSECEFEADGNTLKYELFLPSTWDENAPRTYPVIVFREP